MCPTSFLKLSAIFVKTFVNLKVGVRTNQKARLQHAPSPSVSLVKMAEEEGFPPLVGEGFQYNSWRIFTALSAIPSLVVAIRFTVINVLFVEDVREKEKKKSIEFP